MAVTNFANSNEEAIIITATDAPENNTPNPVTEKYAAHPATISAETPTKYLSQFILIFLIELICNYRSMSTNSSIRSLTFLVSLIICNTSLFGNCIEPFATASITRIFPSNVDSNPWQTLKDLFPTPKKQTTNILNNLNEDFFNKNFTSGTMIIVQSLDVEKFSSYYNSEEDGITKWSYIKIIFALIPDTEI